MTLQRYIIGAAFMLAALIPATSQAKGYAREKIYMFGFAASFSDTIVHFTNIQTIDSAWIETKSNFLMGRQQYSTTLRDYLTKKQMPYRTCVVFYDKSLKKLQKKYLKMKKLYAGTGKKVKYRNNIVDIVENDFKFTAFDYTPYTEEDEVVAEQKKSKKKKEKSGK